jgi:hypothetical protein
VALLASTAPECIHRPTLGHGGCSALVPSAFFVGTTDAASPFARGRISGPKQ